MGAEVAAGGGQENTTQSGQDTTWGGREDTAQGGQEDAEQGEHSTVCWEGTVRGRERHSTGVIAGRALFLILVLYTGRAPAAHTGAEI